MHRSPQARGWSFSSGRVGVAVPEDLVREVGVVLVAGMAGEEEREVAGLMEGCRLSVRGVSECEVSAARTLSDWW